MKIAIFGTGMVGQILAAKLHELGHSVCIGTRDPEKTLARTDKDAFGRPPFAVWHSGHPDIRLATFREAAAGGEFLINATSGQGTLAALEAAGEANLNGKVMLDVANPLDFSAGFPPTLTICNTDSLGEAVQRAWPQLKVVKGLNTLNAGLMVNPGLVPGNHHLFICGNDDAAKERVSRLLQSFGWKAENILDLGDISSSRGTELMLPIWARLFGKLKHPNFNFAVVSGPAPAP